MNRTSWANRAGGAGLRQQGAAIRHRGFTLVELVAAMVIVAALGSVASSILFTATDGYLQASTRAQLHTEASIALDRISRELTSIPLDATASAHAPDIDSVASTGLTWGNGSVLTLSGSNLLLGLEGAASATLVGDVSAFTVRAYDEDNAPLATALAGDPCDDVQRLVITLTLTRNGVNETLRTRVFLRCMMTASET